MAKRQNTGDEPVMAVLLIIFAFPIIIGQCAHMMTGPY